MSEIAKQSEMTYIRDWFIENKEDALSFLDLFSELAAVDSERREEATKQLIAFLRTKKESANQPDYPNLSRDMIYTIKRLCRGICSSRDCARQGFSVGLTYPFAVNPLLPSPSVVSFVSSQKSRWSASAMKCLSPARYRTEWRTQRRRTNGWVVSSVSFPYSARRDSSPT